MDEPVPSLYEDWQIRRDALRSPARPISLEDRNLQIRILDYLLKRYADHPAVRQPARLPLVTELFLNHRAILVQRFLSCAPKKIVSDSAGAQKRVTTILQRMKSMNAQASVATPARGALLGRNENALSVSEYLAQEIETYRALRHKNQMQTVACETDAYSDPNDFYRERLMSDDVLERVGAARELARSGTLDDVNLFLELLALPAELPAQKLLPVVEVESPPPPSTLSPSGGIGAAAQAEPEFPSPPPKPCNTVEDVTAYRDELMNNFEDVSSVIQLLNDAGPPQLPLPIKSYAVQNEDSEPNTSAEVAVLSEPNPVAEKRIDERAVLEECAMNLAKREHPAP